jgi:molybdopterin-guanine dinucleotide biosynthesis protein A
MPLSVVVQAGGQSRRMGRNKALEPFLGQPLIERVIARVRPVADELLLTSNPPEALAHLGLPVYGDVLPVQGALGGLYTALAIASHELVAVVACDMAFASADLLAAERDRLATGEWDGVVPRNAKGLEPFHAVYRREPCMAAIKAALAMGLTRAYSWYDNVRMAYIEGEELAHFDPQGVTFLNVNTPEELRLAEARASAEEN